MTNFVAEGAENGIFENSFERLLMDGPIIRASCANAANADGFTGWNTAATPATTTSERGIYANWCKRGLDVGLVLLSLPFVLPLVALCALALWIEGGTPFYTQDRLGRNGSRFSIFKLRTMVRDADALLEKVLAADPEMRREWDSLQKLKVDPRVTRVGRFLRATSLDELPQLFNVLRGDMSIVGPRPMLPEQLIMYGDPRAYNALRPGITGLWQISTRNAGRFSYRNDVDAAYERNVTFKMDMTILMRTVSVVMRRTGC
mgnify:CR=1 FL=1